MHNLTPRASRVFSLTHKDLASTSIAQCLMSFTCTFSSLFHFWGTPFYFFFSSFSLLPLGLLLLSFDLKVELQRVIDMIYLLDSSVTSLHWCVFFLVFLLCYLDHLESSWTCFDFSFGFLWFVFFWYVWREMLASFFFYFLVFHELS